MPGGYRLPADEVTVDAVRARSLVERGRAALRAGDVPAARDTADRARALFPQVPALDTAEHTRLLTDVVALRAETALAGAGRYDEEDLRRLARVPHPTNPRPPCWSGCSPPRGATPRPRR